MKIVCQTVQEFIDNVRNNEIFEATVWASISSNFMDKDDVKALVYFQASAIIVYPEAGQALVELGVECGTDYNDVTNDHGGTKKAETLRQELKDYCDSNGLTMKPGTLNLE